MKVYVWRRLCIGGLMEGSVVDRKLSIYSRLEVGPVLGSVRADGVPRLSVLEHRCPRSLD